MSDLRDELYWDVRVSIIARHVRPPTSMTDEILRQALQNRITHKTRMIEQLVKGVIQALIEEVPE